MDLSLSFFLSYFSSIPSISRRIRGGNIRKENLAIKTKFFD
jgi:hypothetical protein